MLEKLLLIASFIAVIEVRIPTKAIIPMAIIIIVRIVRSNCPLIEEKAIPRLTLKRPDFMQWFIPCKYNFF
jgi:hypothetical protein